MYYIGDLVKVKENADKIEDDHIAWLRSMNKFKGMEMQVCNVFNHERASKDYAEYNLDNAKGPDKMNGNGYWLFSEKWLEPAGPQFEINEEEFNGLF